MDTMRMFLALIVLIFVFSHCLSFQETNTLRFCKPSPLANSVDWGDEILPDKQAYPQQTPHSGRHFLPSHPAYRRPLLRRLYWKRRRRFMEGWYYRLTLKEENVSFAFIISIEDPDLSSNLRLACIQVVGPEDTYLVQADKDDRKFWARKKQQALGCTFEFESDQTRQETEFQTVMKAAEWKQKVKSGFQILPTRLLGRVDGHDGSQGGVLQGQGIPGTAEFDLTINPICGWGSQEATKQKSTAGWLASFNIFEPHWQVTMADARASGYVVWNNKKYEFTDQPFYAEKNWGAALPSKWYWTQCNSFDGYDQLSVTAGGGVRKLPFGQSESLGMIGIHYNGTFYEAVPWANGFMEWNVKTWGFWNLTGRSTVGDRPFDVEVIYECDPELLPGLIFRAPTPDEGMVYFCRDTFEANVTLSLWDLEWNGSEFERIHPPIINQARSDQGGAEVGGGPWWQPWVKRSQLKPAIRILLRLPFKFQKLNQKLWQKILRKTNER